MNHPPCCTSSKKLAARSLSLCRQTHPVPRHARGKAQGLIKEPWKIQSCPTKLRSWKRQSWRFNRDQQTLGSITLVYVAAPMLFQRRRKIVWPHQSFSESCQTTFLMINGAIYIYICIYCESEVINWIWSLMFSDYVRVVMIRFSVSRAAG